MTVPASPEATSVAILGGTGEQGRGLGRRLAMAGHSVVLGSRDAQRAAAAAEELRRQEPAAELEVTGASNADAATAGHLVVVAVPYDGHRELLESLRETLAGKVVVDCVNPLRFDRHGATAVEVPEGSAAEQAASVLPEAMVVGALHHVSSKCLLGSEPSVDTDVLICGDHAAAKERVAALVGQVPGMRGIDAGPLRLARHLESLTAVLIGINRHYRTHAGVRITGV